MILAGAGLWAGAQNALAGGGSFVTLPALILAGLDPLSANITSTVALFPGQVATGWAGRSMVSGSPSLSVRSLFVISLLGGAVGALLLLSTPVNVFAKLLPFLILFATLVFAWGNFGRKPVATAYHLSPWKAALSQFGTAIYGGYFGGGIGFLMLAVFSIMQIPTRNAVATKNVLAAAMNASAFLALVASPFIRWNSAFVLSVGAIVGGYIGAAALRVVNDKLLKAVIVVFGIVLTIGLFYRSVA